MPVHVPHCHVSGCGAKCLSPVLAAILVVLVATGILAKPLLNSGGVELSSVVAVPFTPTYAFGLYVVAWLLAVFLGSTRKHESTLWCVVDSAGIPATAAFLLGIGGFGH
jgi:hypothetical protein